MGSEHTRQEEAPATVPRLAILLVEDDPGIVSALLQVLRRDGHTVDTVPNGRLPWPSFRTAPMT